MIVVISHENDPHAMRVVDRLQAQRQPVLLFDLAEFPERGTLSIDYSGRAAPDIDFRRGDGECIALHDATAAWWRRPQAPDLAAVTDPQTHLFTANEWTEAINGLWQLMIGVRWMNNPNLDDAASRKARQLREAAAVGLQVPRTLITSDPSRVGAFVEAISPSRAVYKTFSCTHAIWRETRLLLPEDLDRLESVRIAPLIFQEYVPAQADLRVTVVGDQVFPAAIEWKPTDGSIDFRRNVGAATVTATTLPDALRTRLLALMARLGLVYGAIDLRLTPEGEYYFFEVNTAGEFLFIEDRTGQDISGAIAGWLAQRPATISRSVAAGSSLTTRPQVRQDRIRP